MNEIRDNMSDEIIPVGAVEIGEDGNVFTQQMSSEESSEKSIRKDGSL